MQRRKVLSVFLTVVVLFVMGMVASSAMAQDAAPAAMMYIGTVTGLEDEFVGLALQGDSAVIYICDGQADKDTVSVAEWFVGSAGEVIDITAQSGNAVHVEVGNTSAVGKFTLTDGSEKSFSLELVTEANSGLLRSEFSIGDADFIAGWLVLPDGSVRGAVFDAATGDLSPASLASFVPNFVVNSATTEE